MARKILLADDSVTAQNMGRKILTDAGYEVVAVNNGSAALKKIVEQKPDLIVLDVYMPGYSGLEVCQRVKENRDTARIPILLTVGKLEPFKPEEARRARADAFVVKPFEASELISALAKLEEKIGPQPEPYKPGRFAKAVASLDETENASTGEKFGDSDSGWRSRLRFPGKKKKEVESENASPELPAPAKAFRDFRGEPEHSAKTSPPAAREFERSMPAGIPGDITPEEIAAISAAAARLSDVPSPPLEPPSAPQDPISSSTANGTSGEEKAVETWPTASPSSSSPEIPPAALDAMPSSPHLAVASTNLPGEDSAPVTFARAPSFTEAKPLEEKDSEAQPSDEKRLTLEAATAASPAPEISDDKPTEIQDSVETRLAASSLCSDSATATLVEATIHLTDASSTPSTEPSVNSSSEVAKPAEVSAEAATAPNMPITTETSAPQAIQAASLVVATVPAEPFLVSQQEASQPDTPKTEPQPAPPAIEAPTSAAELPTNAPVVGAAQDEEVMAALQNLIPTAGANGDHASPLAAEMPANLVAAVAEFVHAGVPRARWIAEETALSAEEAGLSLEHEMQKAYAAFAATEAARLLATAAIDSLSSVPLPSTLSQIAEIPSAITDPHHANEFVSAVPSAESTPMGESAAGPTDIVMETTVIPEIAAGDQGSPSVVSETVAPAPESEPMLESPAPAEPPASEPPLTSAANPVHESYDSPRPAVPNFVVAASPATASDAIPDSPSAVPVLSTEPIVASAADPKTFSGDEDSMAKNSESGTGFKMIRQSPAGAKAANAAPVTKENFEARTGDPNKAAEPAAMAAAASAESASSVPPMPATAPDPRAIASIVDSVLAELRPKIVEEIAKKLAGPKKE